MSNPSKSETEYIWETAFTWAQFSSFHEDYEDGDFLSSPVFCDCDGVEWCLLLYPNTDPWGSFGQYLSLYVQCKSDNVVVSVPLEITFECTMKSKMDNNYRYWIHTSDGQEAVPRDDKNTQCWGFPEFIHKCFVLPDGTEILSIKCVIKHSRFVFKQNNDRQLSNDLCRMLETSDFSDVDFTVKGQIFHAHKSIVAVHSPVFAAIFKHNMAQNITGPVVIEDIDSTVFTEFLRFIYTGSVRRLEDMVFELVVVADKYNVDGLKVTCELHLCKTLNKNNVENFLELAVKHRLANLKNNALELNPNMRWLYGRI